MVFFCLFSGTSSLCLTEKTLLSQELLQPRSLVHWDPHRHTLSFPRGLSYCQGGSSVHPWASGGHSPHLEMSMPVGISSRKAALRRISTASSCIVTVGKQKQEPVSSVGFAHACLSARCVRMWVGRAEPASGILVCWYPSYFDVIS